MAQPPAQGRPRSHWGSHSKEPTTLLGNPPQWMLLLRSSLNLSELGSVVSLLSGQPSNLLPGGERQLLGPCNHSLPGLSKPFSISTSSQGCCSCPDHPGGSPRLTLFMCTSPLLGPQTGCSNLDALQHEMVPNMQVISRGYWFMVQQTKEYTKNLRLCYFSHDTITYSHLSYSSLKVQNGRKTQQ